jgi:hypothetical protein
MSGVSLWLIAHLGPLPMLSNPIRGWYEFLGVAIVCVALVIPNFFKQNDWTMISCALGFFCWFVFGLGSAFAGF